MSGEMNQDVVEVPVVPAMPNPLRQVAPQDDGGVGAKQGQQTAAPEFAKYADDAAEIVRRHAAVEAGLRTTFDEACAIGKILKKVKKALGRRYKVWLKSIGLKEWNARRYVRCHKHEAEIRAKAKKDTGVFFLGIRAGIESISKKRVKLDGTPVTGADKRQAQPTLPSPEQPITNNGEMMLATVTTLSSQLERVVAGTLHLDGEAIRTSLEQLRRVIDSVLAAPPTASTPTPAPVISHERIELPARGEAQ